MSDDGFTTFPLFSEDLGPPAKRCIGCKQVKPLTGFSEYNRAAVRKQKYGVDRGEYARMFAAQEGRCAVCGNPPSGAWNEKDLLVDHDHATGAVRGLICRACNLGLGKFGDDLDGLLKAVDYLIKGDPESRRRVIERYSTPEQS